MGAQRSLGASVRLKIAPAATRMVGKDLFVSVGGATTPVQRIMGAGVDLWWEFVAGRTIGEASSELARRTPLSRGEVHTHVVEFAAELIEANLAEPTW